MWLEYEMEGLILYDTNMNFSGLKSSSHSIVVSTPAFYSGGPEFYGFPQSLHDNSGIILPTLPFMVIIPFEGV
jgi:hypothetical protein